MRSDARKKHDGPMTRDPRASAGDGLRLNLAAIRERHRMLPSRGGSEDIEWLLVKVDEMADRLLAAHPEPGEAASVGDGLAGLLAVHDDTMFDPTTREEACICAEPIEAGTEDVAEWHRAHLAAVIVRDWLPGETARLRAKVERVEALCAAEDARVAEANAELAAEDRRTLLGHPIRIGSILSTSQIRAALEDGDR